jgi:16S rRNA (guanine966-N2)-methyltransferase
MRIVAGAWRGRTLVAPPGQGTRPTADRVRQAVFDMLMHAEWGGRAAVEGAVVLDVFAGTGALGLEALSRGAASACFIESDPAALRALRANVAACKAEDQTRVLAGDVLDVRPATAPVSCSDVSRLGLARPPMSCRGEVVGGGAKPGHDTNSKPGHGTDGRPGHGTASRPAHDIKNGRDSIASGMQGRSVHPVEPAPLVFLDPPYAQNLVPRAIAHLRQTGHIGAGALIIAETGRDEIWLPQEPLLADRPHGAARILIFRTA